MRKGHKRPDLRTTGEYGEWDPDCLAKAAAAIDAWVRESAVVDGPLPRLFRNRLHTGGKSADLERARRIERPTLTLARLCSTPELRPRSKWSAVMAEASGKVNSREAAQWAKFPKDFKGRADCSVEATGRGAARAAISGKATATMRPGPLSPK